jgi:hypothetical protein
MSSERRRFPRIPLLAEAWLNIGDERMHVRTRDLSRGGVCVELAPGTAVENQTACRVEITLPSREHVEFDGIVAWVRAKTAGVRFEKVSSEAQVLLDAEVARILEELKSLEDEKTPS